MGWLSVFEHARDSGAPRLDASLMTDGVETGYKNDIF